MSFETAIEQWREGERVLAAAPVEDQPALLRVEEALVAELPKEEKAAPMPAMDY